MKYRTLGSTGLKVSVIGIGTWQFGGEWGKDFQQAEVDAMFARGHELGINLVDTAECYGDHLSESLIGRAIEGKRKDWIIATKFGHRYLGFKGRGDARIAFERGETNLDYQTTPAYNATVVPLIKEGCQLFGVLAR